MKTSWSLSFALLGVFSVISSSSAFSATGNEGGHGGDVYALEFITLGTALATALPKYETSHPDVFTKWHLSPAAFASAIHGVRVVSNEGDQVILDGRQVDAINYPARSEILVSRARWREDDLHARLQLVLHEYFGILGVERDSFGASIDFAAFVADLALELSGRSFSNEFMANLFYGRCVSVPALLDSSICDESSDSMAQAMDCAKTEAQGKCRLSGRAQCQVVSISENAILSDTTPGLRYCEILAVIH